MICGLCGWLRGDARLFVLSLCFGVQAGWPGESSRSCAVVCGLAFRLFLAREEAFPAGWGVGEYVSAFLKAFCFVLQDVWRRRVAK